jgi:hypothetical protein
MRTRLIVAAVVAATIGTVVAAAPAAAQQPVQIRISEPATFVLDAPDWCPSADVRFDVAQKFKLIMFPGSRGFGFTALTVGGISVTVTNLESGRSVRLQAPGPGFLDDSGLPIVGSGPWVTLNPGAVLYAVGRITFVPSEFGVDVGQVSGRLVNVCALVDAG